MKILISGSTGLIGTALTKQFTKQGHRIYRLVRTLPLKTSENIHWEPDRSILPGEQIEGMDAVIHLAGENIAGGRWTGSRKERIIRSRVTGTKLLAETLAGLERKPAVFICASGINYYGSRGEAPVDESVGIGEGFLPKVCGEWEKATDPAAAAGIRTAQMRIGMVLSGDGGAISKMLPAFSLGLGGRLGTGKQYMSWIAITDLVRAIECIINDETISGPVNLTGPGPVTNLEFTRAIGKVLGRPTFLAVPVFILKLIYGRMADELLLSSIRAHPRKLTEAGFEFQYPELGSALAEVLK